MHTYVHYLNFAYLTHTYYYDFICHYVRSCQLIDLLFTTVSSVYMYVATYRYMINTGINAYQGHAKVLLILQGLPGPKGPKGETVGLDKVCN